MLSNDLFLGFKYAKSDKHNNFLSKVGIIFGIAITIIIMSVISGFEHEIEEKLLTYIPHIDFKAKYNQQFLMEDKYIEKLKKEKDIVELVKYSEFFAFVKLNKEHEKLLVTGVNLKDTDFYNLNLDESCKNNFNKKNSICLSEYLVKKLKLKLNDKIKILSSNKGLQPHYESYQYTGKIKSKIKIFNNIAIMSEDNVKEKLDIKNSEGIRIKISKPFKAIELASKYRELIEERKIINTWYEDFMYIYKDFSSIKILSYWVLFFIVILSLLNIISNLLINLKKKEREIEILKSMGYSKNRIKRIFLISVSYNYIKSVCLAILIGVLLSFNLLNLFEFFNISKTIFAEDFFSAIPVKINYTEIVIMFFSVLLLNMFFVNLSIKKALKKL
jgi:lipoprotein-releasing system permease protein